MVDLCVQSLDEWSGDALLEWAQEAMREKVEHADVDTLVGEYRNLVDSDFDGEVTE